MSSKSTIIKGDEKITTNLGNFKLVVTKKIVELKINDEEKLEVKDDLLKLSQISNRKKEIYFNNL